MSTTIHAAVTPPSSNCTTTSVPSTPIIPEHSSFKNRLQEYTQRASIPFPSYATVNVNGPCQVPQFRSSVTVDGETYTSLSTFLNKKAAEQDAAKVALEGLSKKIKDCISKKTSINGFPPIFQDKVFCKSILHEFAAKKNMEMPKYDTVQLEGLVRVFITSVFFNGVKYTGTPSVNKKEAEQLAARTAILSILGDSEIGMHLSEVVKSKAKLFSILHGDAHVNECLAISSVQPKVEATLETSAIKGDCQGTSKTDCATENVVALSVLEQSSSEKGVLEDACQAGNVIENVVSGEFKGQSHDVPSHEFRKHEVGALPLADPHPIEFVTSHFVSEDVKGQSHDVPSYELRNHEVARLPPADPHPTEFVESHVVSGIVDGLSLGVFNDECKDPKPYTLFEPVPLPMLFAQPLEEKIPSSTSVCGRKRKQKKKKKANKKAKEETDTATQVTELHLNQGLTEA